MNVRQYNQLDEELQQIVCRQHGVFLIERQECGTIYRLHQLDSFYIEVAYSIPFNTLQYFVAFDSIYKLDPYLAQIDISILWAC